MATPPVIAKCPLASNYKVTRDKKEQTVTYDLPSGTKIITYPNGHPSPDFGKKVINYHDDMVMESRIVHQQQLKGKKIHHTQRNVFLGNKSNCELSLMTDLETREIISAFPRHKGTHNTPLDGIEVNKRFHSLGIYLSTLNLAPEGNKIVNDSIRAYFNDKRKDIDSWVKTADEKFLIPWMASRESLCAYELFSSLNWYMCSHFILGVLENQHEDYAFVWNRLLAPGNGIKSMAIKAWTKFTSLDNGLMPYLLNHIRSVGPFAPPSIIKQWKDNHLSLDVIRTLDPKESAQIFDIVFPTGMSMGEKVLLDNAIGLMLGMQETVSFTMTEFLFQLDRNPGLKEEALKSDESFNKVLQEVMRVYPAAGATREWGVDAEVITSDNQHYEFKKGEAIGLSPVHIAHHPDFYNNSTTHDPYRSEKNVVRLFGGGPHLCPGQSFAMPWIRAVLKHILNNYEWSVTCQVNLDQVKHVISFTTRHEPPLQISLRAKGTVEPVENKRRSPIQQIFDELDEHYIK